MSLAKKTVKGEKYLYFVYYDPVTRSKKEKYCGPANSQKSLEKAKDFEKRYLEIKNDLLVSKVDSNTSKLRQLESPNGKKVRNNHANQLNPNNSEYTTKSPPIHGLALFKKLKMNEPEIYYKSSESMKEVKSGSVQLIVTSPPYNVDKSYSTYNDNKDFEEYLTMLRTVWEECKRVLSNGGRIAINVADTGRQPYLPLHVHITKQMLDLGFQMRGVVYWDKGPSVGVSTAWGSWRSASNPTLRDVGEHILIFCKDKFKMESHNNISTITSLEFTEYSKSIWTFPTANAGKEGHPAPFPEELPRRLIKFYTYYGDTVLDPFLGSGTTCKVAKSLGRKSIGYEMDQGYQPIIENKIAQVKDLAISLDSLTINGKPLNEENVLQARFT